MNSAIVMTVCQRPFYLRPVLEGWAKVRGVKDWPFIFMVEPTPTKEAMLREIAAFEHPNKTVIENEKKLGVLSNPWAGLELAFKKNEFVVLAEEDLLPATNLLEYFSWARDEFATTFDEFGAKTEHDVAAVCANGTGIEPYKIVTEERFAVWLWGTWRDKWVKYLRDTWDHDYTSGGRTDSGWDWNIDTRIIKKHGLVCIFPKAPLVDNLGEWGGTHAIAEEYELTRPIGFVQEIEPGTFEAK